MANTEGLPDEFVESLMTTSIEDTTRKSSNQRRLERLQRLQEKMELPMPEGGPAARVIRASPQAATPATIATRTQEAESDDQPTPSASSTTPQPIIGNIVERPLQRQSRAKTSTTAASKNGMGRKVSRFAQQQQQLASNGFPSVHMPLGTFVQKKKHIPSKDSVPPIIKKKKQVTIAKDSIDLSTTTTKKTSHPRGSRNGGITTESLLQASQKDAHDMLQGMSVSEIKEQQQELQAALSPDMVAFLKRRGKKSNQAKQASTATNAEPKTLLKSNTPLQNKEWIAQIVSQVQSHQDLDDAYHQVMNESHPLEQRQSHESAEEPDPSTDTPTGKDFALACDLLRSTNPRQNLWAAKVVQQELNDRVKGSWDMSSARDWPLLLPVSLRCLLDEPLQMNSGYQLHTSVLESLYLLLLLNAHPDHIIRVHYTSTIPNDASIFQECCLNDAVPTPSLETAYSSTTTIQPLTVNKDGDSSKGPAAAYSTQSSSASAQSDAAAFEKDPMWTLLSKMKILPRLAQLVQQEDRGGPGWPTEAWMAILGILAMIGQRSPGAASAIVHHDVLVPALLQRFLLTVQEGFSEEISELEVAHAVLVLFGTLARQSKVTAKALPLLDILPPLIIQKAHSPLTLRLQQLGLQLWRSVLRYGLGLEALETMTAAASHHLSLPYTNEFSLSIDFVSCLTVVVDCARLAKTKLLEGSLMNGQGQPVIDAQTLEILSMTSSYVAATFRQVLLQPISGPPLEEIAAFRDQEQYQKPSQLKDRWNAARLGFLTSYWGFTTVPSLPNQTPEANPAEEIKVEEEWAKDEILGCLQVLGEWTESGDLLEKAWKELGGTEACQADWKEAVRPKTAGDLTAEASASAFLKAYASLILAIGTSPMAQSNVMIKSLCDNITRKFVQRIMEDKTSSETNSGQKTISLARKGWINSGHTYVSKIFFHSISAGWAPSKEALSVLRKLVFSVIGRLELGEEATFAVMMSQDILFQSSSKGLGRTSSPISSLFLGEICGSDRGRQQLDHSFKLQGGFGITKEGFGAFGLDSLLSSGDHVGARPRGDEGALRLPLGKLWLWQSLSGQIQMKNQGVVEGTSEASSVIEAVLELLLELESAGSTAKGATDFSQSIPMGARMYYLVNVCLQSELVLRNSNLQNTAEGLLQFYDTQLNNEVVVEFARECQIHTDPKSAEEDLEEKDKKLLRLFNPEVPNELALSKEEMRCLEALLDDLMDAYNDYGAQYDIFTKVIRLFLISAFPASLRIRALEGLRGVLHLLTLPQEAEDEACLKRMLMPTLLGGVSSKDTRDTPELLDSVTITMMPNTLPRALHGHLLRYGLATLVRNLALSIITGGGFDAMKQRLFKIDKNLCTLVLGASKKILSNRSRTRADIVEAVFAEFPSGTCFQPHDSCMALPVLDEQLEDLRKSFEEL